MPVVKKLYDPSVYAKLMAADSGVNHQAVSTVIREVDIVSGMVVGSDVPPKDVQMELSRLVFARHMAEAAVVRLWVVIVLEMELLFAVNMVVDASVVSLDASEWNIELVCAQDIRITSTAMPVNAVVFHGSMDIVLFTLVFEQIFKYNDEFIYIIVL